MVCVKTGFTTLLMQFRTVWFWNSVLASFPFYHLSIWFFAQTSRLLEKGMLPLFHSGLLSERLYSQTKKGWVPPDPTSGWHPIIFNNSAWEAFPGWFPLPLLTSLSHARAQLSTSLQLPRGAQQHARGWCSGWQGSHSLPIQGHERAGFWARDTPGPLLLRELTLPYQLPLHRDHITTGCSCLQPHEKHPLVIITAPMQDFSL